MATRVDNVGIVVEDLERAVAFFSELGLELQGQGMVSGEWAGRFTGLADPRIDVALMSTPDRQGRIELSRFVEPPVSADHRSDPVNSLGYLRVMFGVDDIHETLERLSKYGVQLVSDEVVVYDDAFRICYLRGPENIMIGLSQALSSS